MAALVATDWPLTYSVPVLPARVTAMCVQTPDEIEGPLSCCSPPPLTLIENRSALVVPASGETYM